MTETFEQEIASAEHPPKPDLVVRRPEPFEEFYVCERPSMVVLAYATSRSRLAAEAIAQDAFMAAFHDWERIGRLDNPSTWVRRVVVNRSVSLIRLRIASAKKLDRLEADNREAMIPAVPAETKHIWDAVGRLSRRQRQVVALRYVDELRLNEIADVLGCSKESVNTHLRRSHTRLARYLREERRG